VVWFCEYETKMDVSQPASVQLFINSVFYKSLKGVMKIPSIT